MLSARIIVMDDKQRGGLMEGKEPVPPTREERIRRFTELDDDDQEVALSWLVLEQESDPYRRAVAAELISSEPLSADSKQYLIYVLLFDDIMDQVERALEKFYAERD